MKIYSMSDIIVVLVIVLLPILVFFIIRNKYIAYVKQNSILFGKLEKLNLDFVFNDLKNVIYFTDEHSSKVKFDRDTCYDFMYRSIYENTYYYEKLVQDAIYNKNLYLEYETKYINLNNNIDNISVQFGKKFLKTEQKIYNKNKLMPVIIFNTVYKLTYHSPKGRNHYTKESMFLQFIIEEQIYQVYKDKGEKQTRKHRIKIERSKVTDGVRYNILKRDNFTCQICGSQASDGVKLHIDHKVPISKGGLTEESNLQVLCDRCNIGKSNKYKVME